MRRELGADRPGCVVVLALAALVPRKGLDVLIDSLRYPSCVSLVCWIAGDGPERTALTERCAARGLAARVRFLGFRNDKADLLQACDVVAVPSRREGLGTVALEGMFAGRPVVASRVGGLEEVVLHERTGLLVPPNEPGALAAALGSLARDATYRRTLGLAGTEWIRSRFLACELTAAYEELYMDVLGLERDPSMRSPPSPASGDRATSRSQAVRTRDALRREATR